MDVHEKSWANLLRPHTVGGAKKLPIIGDPLSEPDPEKRRRRTSGKPWLDMGISFTEYNRRIGRERRAKRKERDARIVELWKQGLTRSQIAREVGLQVGQVGYVIRLNKSNGNN